MTTVEVPEGAAAPEQPVKGTKDTSADSKKKLVLFVTVLALIVGTALMVALIPDWKGNGKKATNGTTESSTEQLKFVESEGVFDVKIPVFSSDVTKGYDSEEEMASDLEILAKASLNDAIRNNMAYAQDDDAGTDQEKIDGNELESDFAGEEMDFDEPTAPAMEEASDVGMDDASATAGGLDGVSDFETNNQEETVDQADFVKSNGDLVFAVYGDKVVIWTAAGGDMTASFSMPPITEEPICNEPYVYDDDVWIERPLDDVDILEEDDAGDEDVAVDPPPPAFIEPAVEPGVAEPAIVDSMPRPGGIPEVYCYTPKPYIQSLLFEDDYLIVIAAGYGQKAENERSSPPLIYGYQDTKLAIYKMEGVDPVFVQSKDFNGNYLNAFLVGGVVHMVTRAQMNTYDHLGKHVDRYNPAYEGMDDEQYLEAATVLAETVLIPEFTQNLMDDLQASGTVDLARLSFYAPEDADDSTIASSSFVGSIGGSITNVISLDLGSRITATEDLATSITSTVQPGSWGHVYATGGMILVADQNWGDWEQTTFLLGFRTDGPSTALVAVGSVPGHMLGSYSLDFVEKEGSSYVRIATTETDWGGDMVFIDPILEPAEDIAIDFEETETIDFEETEPSTINKIYILKLPLEEGAEAKMGVTGEVQLGKPGERFTSVRFFDDWAYAVTFRQIDPFYVVDLEDPTNPTAIGELEITGFSEYMHPVTPSGDLLIAVGQETVDGRVVGVQVSLFDSSTPTRPELVDRFLVEQEENTWSHSTVSWDEKAFRYVSTGQEEGYVIMPMSIYFENDVVFEDTFVDGEAVDEIAIEPIERPQTESFEGFTVLKLKDKRISKAFDIDHNLGSMDADHADGCYSCGWLSERSFVFSGDVMTMKGQTIISTDLATGENEWSFDLNNEAALLCCDDGW